MRETSGFFWMSPTGSRSDEEQNEHAFPAGNKWRSLRCAVLWNTVVLKISYAAVSQRKCSHSYRDQPSWKFSSLENQETCRHGRSGWPSSRMLPRDNNQALENL